VVVPILPLVAIQYIHLLVMEHLEAIQLYTQSINFT
jgi:hypothetical protein